MEEKLEEISDEPIEKPTESDTDSDSDVPNPGYSNMMGRPTGHKHDEGFDDYKGFSNYSGPSGHRH